MKNKLTNQDIYTRTLKSIVSKKNTILVLPPDYVKLLYFAVDGELAVTERELKLEGIPIKAYENLKRRVKQLEQLKAYIAKARKEAKEVTDIDHLITKISVWPEEDRLTK